jgi:dihydropteroate synthase
MFFSDHLSMRCKGELMSFSSPKIMGILNVTPDSFFDGGKFTNEKDLLNQVEKLLKEGADILDIGAMSSRPGAILLSAQEEIDRLKTPLRLITKNFPNAVLSCDTYQSEVAEFAINEEVAIINDISGGNLDEEMYQLIAKYQIPYILMHMRGTPQTMQQQTDYANLLDDIVLDFSEKINKLQRLGVNDIILDPGFGFAKNIDQNYALLKRMEVLKVFKLPILAGLSRKSMLYKFLDIDPNQALNATSIVNLMALQNGANILRVHDVKEAKECIKLYEKIQKS